MISTRRLAFVGTLSLAIGVLAAYVVVSQADRDDTFEAIATIGVGRVVANEDLDAERQAMIERLESDRLDQILAESGATELEFIMPDSRSNIAVIARAPTAPPAVAAAESIAREIAATEAARSSAPLEAQVAELESQRVALIGEREAQQAEIDALIPVEGRLTVPLAGFLSDEERAELETELLSIQEQLSGLRTERDVLVDEANALLNDRFRAELRRVTDGREPFVIVPSTTRDAAEDVVRSALVTFALAAAAAAAGSLALTSPKKLT